MIPEGESYKRESLTEYKKELMVRTAQGSSDPFISRGVQAEVFDLEDKLETSDDHHGLLYLCGAVFSRNSTFKECKKKFF